MNKFKPTSGASWRKAREEGELIELPSGNLARLRAVSPLALVASGEIPDMLTPLVAQVLSQGVDATQETINRVIAGIESDDSEAPDVREAFAGLKRMTSAFDAICAAVFVSPKVVENPTGDDEISPDDLDLADKLHAVHLATQPLAVLQRFRYEPPADVAVVHDSEGDGEPA